jgi:hypothetical protein
MVCLYSIAWRRCHIQSVKDFLAQCNNPAKESGIAGCGPCVDHAWVIFLGLVDPQKIVDLQGFFGLVDNVDYLTS